MKNYTPMLLAVLIVLFLVASSSLYIVDQRQQAILFQLGEVVDVKTSPGLYFKIPVAQNVRYFDSRILSMDTAFFELSRMIRTFERYPLRSII